MAGTRSSERRFDGRCPWCRAPASLSIDKPVISAARRCSCGAIALGAPPHDFDEVLDDALGYFGVQATTAQKNLEPPAAWLASAGVDLVPGGSEDRTVVPPAGVTSTVPSLRYAHYWFRRSSILDAPALSERMFFPQRRVPPHVRAIDVGATELACYEHRPLANAPLLVHFHGNGECAADYVDMAPALAARGINSLFVDYRGYGASPGAPALVGMLADAEHVLAAVDEPLARVFVYGRSIGSIYAIEAAYRRPEIGGLIVESGIADPLERILVRVTPDELGLDRAGLEREVSRHLDHRAKLAAYAGRVLVLHARGDHLISLSHAERNAAWAPRGELVVFEHGDHNTILAANHDAILDHVARFVNHAVA